MDHGRKIDETFLKSLQISKKNNAKELRNWFLGYKIGEGFFDRISMIKKSQCRYYDEISFQMSLVTGVKRRDITKQFRAQGYANFEILQAIKDNIEKVEVVVKKKYQDKTSEYQRRRYQRKNNNQQSTRPNRDYNENYLKVYSYRRSGGSSDYATMSKSLGISIEQCQFWANVDFKST